MDKYNVTDYESGITIPLKCPECESYNLDIQNQYKDGDEYECMSCDYSFKATETYIDYLIQEEIDKQEEINIIKEIELKPLFVKKRV